MTKKLFASLVCAFGFLLLGAHPAFAGSVSTSAYAEASDGLFTTCTDTGSTSASCNIGGHDLAGAGVIYFPNLRVLELDLGAAADGPSQAYGLASGSINDLLTFTDGSLTGPAFVEFTFGVQTSGSNSCIYQSLDATAGNQAVPSSLLSYGQVASTFTTTPQAVTFGSPFGFGMSGDVSCSLGALFLSLDLEDVLVLNANGSPILGISLTSGSGTNYPLDSRNITPEPASLSLLATGILGIFAAVRRKMT
ncbi:MAG: PEP-CTERM sorting domain-containing protein [Candidatus Acidiferrales bacterium]